MPSYRRQFIDGKYGQIHLRMYDAAASSKPPLICLHMFPQSGRNYGNFIEAMGTDRTVIAPDFPGYGESSAPAQPIDATGYAESIGDLIDQLSLSERHDQVDIFGIHAGSKLAVELAYQRSHLIRKLILSSAAILLPEEIEQMNNSLAHVPLDEKGTRYQLFWDMLLRNKNSQTNLEMAADNFAEMIRGGEKYSWGHQAVFAYNALFPERLKSLPHAIALLNPEDDLYEMTPRTQAYLRNGEMIDLPGWGFGFLETHANELAEIVNEFLDRDDEQLKQSTLLTQSNL
ncbi:MAG: alpha/beta hydrolase [Parasphingorhabdus sp.]|uniref:alpha/beta fold hydrolase n=1 Tax=Parasphingorhabdus sp. TaxID=2709688 RepID=UPI003298CC46